MKAVEAANNNETGMMITLNRENKKDYSCITKSFDIHEIANVEKKLPLEWIDTKNNQMKKII